MVLSKYYSTSSIIRTSFIRHSVIRPLSQIILYDIIMKCCFHIILLKPLQLPLEPNRAPSCISKKAVMIIYKLTLVDSGSGQKNLDYRLWDRRLNAKELFCRSKKKLKVCEMFPNKISKTDIMLKYTPTVVRLRQMAPEKRESLPRQPIVDSFFF